MKTAIYIWWHINKTIKKEDIEWLKFESKWITTKWWYVEYSYFWKKFRTYNKLKEIINTFNF